MIKNERWTPTATEINRLLVETDSRRSEMNIALREQKVSIKRS